MGDNADMRSADIFNNAGRALAAHGARSWLTLLAVAFGAASVVLLSSLGEGARRYVLDEFTQLGTHLLIVLPGRNETAGGPPPLLGETPRDLTLARRPGAAALALCGARRADLDRTGAGVRR